MDEKSSEYLFDEIEIGLKKKFQVTIIEHMLNDFAKLSGDYNPLHVNEEHASSTSFKKRVANGDHDGDGTIDGNEVCSQVRCPNCKSWFYWEIE